MILAELQGNLSGKQVMHLNRYIPYGDYKVQFSFSYDGINFTDFNPPFPVLHYEKHIEFNPNNDYISLIMKVVVFKPHVRSGQFIEELDCNECSKLNEGWDRLGKKPVDRF